ncbi:MAG TPA: hypothetical protein VJY33_01270, partial [Isosphaeraceae bacterium]|jgi:hypothetical protein|nr:hypothetical protein [Isosphaeraceae bacterium]
MLRRRAFRPALWDALESRIALSNVAAVGSHRAALDERRSPAADVQSATTTPTSPTYEELTTTYANGDAGNIVGVGNIIGTTQTEYRLTVPTSSNTTTTTESINLAGGAGLETVVDVSTKQGNTTTDNITTTLPDGLTTTKTEIQNTYGRMTTIDAWLTTPGVGIQTTMGTTIQSGQKAITREVIHTAAGNVYHYHRVVIQSSPLESSETSTTTGPDGRITNQVKSTTTITPLPLPAS